VAKKNAAKKNQAFSGIAKAQEFTARLQRAETKSEVFATGGLYYLTVPAEIAQEFTSGRPVRIVCLLNGTFERHGALRSKGEGSFFIGFGKEVVKEAGLSLGEEVYMRIWRDNDDYGLELPAELHEVFELDPEAKSAWSTFTPGRQRSWLIYMRDAKSEQTRIKRAFEIAEKLKTNTFYTAQAKKTKDED
jgi:hypothetical protein